MEGDLAREKLRDEDDFGLRLPFIVLSDKARTVVEVAPALLLRGSTVL